MEKDYFEFIIIGGGIAGVACAETLCELIRPSRFGGAGVVEQVPASSARIALISATPTIKTTINLRRITRMIESFDVAEMSGDIWSDTWPGTLTLIYNTVERLDSSNHLLYLSNHVSGPLRYGRLCLCTGGVPRLIDHHSPFVIALRDTESLATFQSRLQRARRLLLVGNGGIATEVAHEVRGCQIVWAIKDSSISTPFLDPAAAKFLLHARETYGSTRLTDGRKVPELGVDQSGPVRIRRMRYVIPEVNAGGCSITGNSDQQLVLIPVAETRASLFGTAVGPDWAQNRDFCGKLTDSAEGRLLKVVYQVRVERVLEAGEFQSLHLEESNPFPNTVPSDSSWPVFVQLSNGEVYGCDLVVCAVGVEASFQPNRCPLPGTKGDFFAAPFEFAPSSLGGGLLVDDQMQTSVDDVYAAGDCAYANWTWAPHWFQMRLWTQARQMGFQAAKAMYGHSRGEKEVPLDFSFELFTHVTYFFGFKVVLLGLYNGQGLDLTSPDCYLLLRSTPGQEYVKCIMQSGRMQGALLIGETDLEETLENLIINQLDLTDVEDSLLDPDIDLSDYFD